MSDVTSGLRHGVRGFRRAPGFAALTVVILATGTGASTVRYTLVQGMLLRELPFQDPDRLVWIPSRKNTNVRLRCAQANEGSKATDFASSSRARGSIPRQRHVFPACQ